MNVIEAGPEGHTDESWVPLLTILYKLKLLLQQSAEPPGIGDLDQAELCEIGKHSVGLRSDLSEPIRPPEGSLMHVLNDYLRREETLRSDLDLGVLPLFVLLAQARNGVLNG
jgi:hypothetical protein